MPACLCGTIRELLDDFDEARARLLVPSLNSHLKDIQRLIAQSTTLSRGLTYGVSSSNHRTNRILATKAVDPASFTRLMTKDPWVPISSNDSLALRRRLACVVIFLRSKLNAKESPCFGLPGFSDDRHNISELKDAGRKYIKIARRLGGLGSLLWLPMSVPHSTYERYLNIDDEEVFDHLKSMRPVDDGYCDFVRSHVLNQLQSQSPGTDGVKMSIDGSPDDSVDISYYNLCSEYGDLFHPHDQLMLLLYGLGGLGIPEVLLKGVQNPQRRWNVDGEIETTIAEDSYIPSYIVAVLSDAELFRAATCVPSTVNRNEEDGIVTWSLDPEKLSSISVTLLPETAVALRTMCLRLMCFVTPPCFEGNTDWSPRMKEKSWSIFEKMSNPKELPSPLRGQVLEAALYFAERDSIAMRKAAVQRAKSLLRKSMPYYLHAAPVVFQSILSRVDGELIRSESIIRDFFRKGPRPVTRRDQSMKGRLHISEIENKIKLYDNDVSEIMYAWEAEQPLSALDLEVTSRHQQTAARYFTSIGEFETARASLEDYLSLNSAKPIRGNTRRLIAARLADICCELGDYAEAIRLLQPELDDMDAEGRSRRPYRRLLLGAVEAYIGLGQLSDAEGALRQLEGVVPLAMQDVHDQQLYMREKIATARLIQIQGTPENAVKVWKATLDEVEQMNTLKGRQGFVSAMIHLSLAYAQLFVGDREGAPQSWAVATKLLETEICEFWLPIVPTIWLRQVMAEVHQLQGWSLRMKLPGSRADFVWPK